MSLHTIRDDISGDDGNFSILDATADTHRSFMDVLERKIRKGPATLPSQPRGAMLTK